MNLKNVVGLVAAVLITLTTSSAQVPSAPATSNALPVSRSSPSSPGPNNAPLPDIATLFKDVEAHQKQLESLRRNYVYRAVEQEDELDDSGQVKHSKNEEREIFYVGRRHISRLLRKDGVDLTASEQKKEQERVDKEIEELKKREAKRQRDDDEGKHSDNNITLDTFLRIARFENPRRISFKSRDTIAFDFSGNPDYKTHGMAESAVKKIAGTVWIDEAGRQVVRMEVRLNEPFKIGAGLLASIQKGSSFVFEQALVNGEIWLPTYTESNVVGRLFLFKGIREHSIAHYSDYRKFHVASKMEVVGQTTPP